MSKFSITKPFYKLCPTLLLCLLTGQASAAFYFNKSFEVIEIDTNNEESFEQMISVDFKSVCELSGCDPQGREQDYRFGLSSANINPKPSGSGSNDRPSLTHNNWMKNNFTFARYQQKDIPVTRRQWSHLFKIDRKNAVWRSAMIMFKFDESILDSTPTGQCKNFYLVGLDDESTKFWDTLEICLRKNDNRKIKISNLRDMYLSKTNNSLENGRIMPFCVYVSDGSDYTLQTTGLHVDNFNKFNLSNGSNTIPYKMAFSPRVSGDEWEIFHQGDALKGSGNSNTDCGGNNNARFKIYLDGSVESATSGAYSDTITVTVIAT